MRTFLCAISLRPYVFMKVGVLIKCVQLVVGSAFFTTVRAGTTNNDDCAIF